MLISFLDLASRGGRGGALLIETGIDFGISFLLLLLVGGVRGVNFEEILALSMLVFWSVNNASHLATYCRYEVPNGISHAIEIIEVVYFTTIDLFVLNVFGQEIKSDFDILGVWCEMFNWAMKRYGVERTTL